MHQAPARIWNRIADEQTLRTAWAQQMFPLPEEQMETALEREGDRLTKEADGDSLVAAMYLRVMPLVWEADAIRRDAMKHGPNPALPLIETAQEAAIVASKDYPMTKAQIRKLHAMLRTEPT